MVIHIVNGFKAEKLPFLQFIYKSEQFDRSILAGENQVAGHWGRRPVENPADELARNAETELGARRGEVEIFPCVRSQIGNRK
jgi:hypothetical protein